MSAAGLRQQLSLDNLQSRIKAHEFLVLLLKKRVQADHAGTILQIQTMFTKLSVNSQRLRKLQQLLPKLVTARLELVFDKIRANSWAVEERRLALEAVIIRSLLKQAMQVWFKEVSGHLMLGRLVHIIQSYQTKLYYKKAIVNWRNHLESTTKELKRNSKLNAVLEKQVYLRSGFHQFRQRIQQGFRVR